MKRIYCVAALAVVLLPGMALGQSMDADDCMVIRVQGNPYLSDFINIQGKRSDLRVEVSRKGLDAAFSDWMRSKHPGEYEDCCVQQVQEILNTPHMGDFQGLLSKRSDLRAQIALKGQDVAFLDWMRSERPEDYKAHFTMNGLKPSNIRSPYLNEFVTILGKRADLRTALAKKGLDAAFTEWLNREHPDASKR